MPHSLDPAATQVDIVRALCEHGAFGFNNTAQCVGDFTHVNNTGVRTWRALVSEVFGKHGLAHKRCSWRFHLFQWPRRPWTFVCNYRLGQVEGLIVLGPFLVI